MIHQQPRSDKAVTPNIIRSQLAEMETRIAAMIDMQTEIFARPAQINRDWFHRAKSEARLASDLSAKYKLTAAHSVPDVTTAIRSSTASMFADDSCRFFSENQKFMEIGAQLLANGHPGAITWVRQQRQPRITNTTQELDYKKDAEERYGITSPRT